MCTSCAAGKYQPSTGRTGCIDCEGGKYVASTGNALETACTSCNTGRYSASGDGLCTQCPQGQYQDATGSKECMECISGYFSKSSGATSCSQCSAGDCLRCICFLAHLTVHVPVKCTTACFALTFEHLFFDCCSIRNCSEQYGRSIMRVLRFWALSALIWTN